MYLLFGSGHDSSLVSGEPSARHRGPAPGGPGCRGRSYRTARAALRIRSVTAPGWDTIAAWDESIWTVWACIRAAMKRSAAGGIAWSWLATRYQDGMVFQAGTPEGSLRVASAPGRWVAAITAAVTSEQSAQKACWKTAGLM